MHIQTNMRRVVALAVVLVFAGVACGSGTTDKPPTTVGKAGGTFRIEADEFPWESSGNGFDPVSEYVGTDWMIFSNLLVRNLMGYRHRPAPTGIEVLPDLATGPGVFASDNLSVTYTMRKGIKFGPPVDREINAKDIEYAFERLATPALDSGGYKGYYSEYLLGFTEFEEKKADKLSGIEVPADDPYKITFKFNKPNFDWDYRVAMPAAAPVPREVAGCFKKALEYGQYVVSSGPYTFEGMDKLDFEPCKDIKPVSGFDFSSKMFLVRNKNYDAATDNKEMRSALPDRFEWRKNTNPKDSFSKIEVNKIDYSMSAIPAEVLAKYSTTDALKPFLKSGFSENATWYVTMNLALPPFDDINVRKAANFALDKAGLLKVIGGRLKGSIAEHIIPPGLLGGKLAAGEFDPYATPDHAGDVAKAKEAMKLSGYDTDKDGLCDTALCKSGDIRMVTRNTDPFPDMAPIIEKAFESIGIKVRTVEAASYYGEIGIPANKVELGAGGGWGPDWPEPLTFMEVPLKGSAIGAAGNINTGLVGLTKEQAATYKIKYPSGGIASIDADIDKCATLQGDPRVQCWIDLDKHVMNDIVPWIPLRWAESTDVFSAAVTGYDYDQFGGDISLAHVGIDQTKQVS